MAHNRAFTLIEILVVIAIGTFLLGASVAVFLSYNKAKALDVSSQNVVSLLKTARSKTLASEGESVYGVHLESDRAVLFKGSTFSEPNPDNRDYQLPSSVTISIIDLNGGGSDIIFERLTGETQQFGTTTISRKDSSDIIEVVIGEAGVIEF